MNAQTKQKVMKRVVPVFMFLCVLFGNAASVLAINTTSPNPQINASFNEAVQLIDANLTAPQIKYTLQTQGSGTDLLQFNPLESLPNLKHMLQILVSDYQNNRAVYQFEFNVSAPGQRIWLVEPEYGGTSNEKTDLLIGTQYDSYCRWSNTILSYSDAVWDRMTPLVREAYGERHQLLDFYTAIGKAPQPDVTERIIVACNNNGNITAQPIFITYLNDSADISLSANPAVITDLENPVTTITINSNQDVWCTANGQNIFGEQATENYDTSESGQFTDTDTIDDVKNITVEVVCENRAGFRTIQDLQVPTAYDAPLDINVTTPLYSKVGSYQLNFTTSMVATCSLKQNDQVVTLNPAKNSVFTVTRTLAQGNNVFYIDCQTSLTETNSTVNVLFDNTPPIINEIKTLPLSCGYNSYYFSINATDPAPGSALHFIYWLRQNNNVTNITSGQTTSTDITMNNLKLTNGTEYVINVMAIDAAGNNVTAVSQPFIGSSQYEGACDSNPPQGALYVLNRTSTSATVIILCKDDESGCSNKYYFAQQPIDQNTSCSVSTSDQGYTYDQNQTITQNSTICYMVLDNSGNMANETATLYITPVADGQVINPELAACSDSVKDYKETDVDCGGIICSSRAAETCAVGKKCISNGDCTTNYCNAATGTCNTPTCTDNAKDGNETGVDCGGDCGACAAGTDSGCRDSIDCSAGEVCKQSICVQPDQLTPEPQQQYPTTTSGGLALFNIILIGFGVLFIFGGAGYIVLYEPPKPVQQQEPISEFSEEPPLTIQGQARGANETRAVENKRTKKLRNRKRIKLHREISEFGNNEQIQQTNFEEPNKDETHAALEEAARTMDPENFASAAAGMLDERSITKQDLHVVLSDAASHPDSDQEAIGSLRDMLGLPTDSNKKTTADENTVKTVDEVANAIKDLRDKITEQNKKQD